MDKRYQVFLSSTFADLQDERKIVSKALRNSGCFVEEMEQFPAADEDQVEFIQNVLAPCDYYLLIIRNRYGSTNDKGVSFTELEYDYAVKQGLYIIALVYSGADEAEIKIDQDKALKQGLDAFRQKVMTGRMVKQWATSVDLVAASYESIRYAITNHPATGWVRSDLPASDEILGEINELRKTNAKLLEENQLLKREIDTKIHGIAGLDEVHEAVFYLIINNNQGRLVPDQDNPLLYSYSWREWFIACGPCFARNQGIVHICNKLIELVNKDFPMKEGVRRTILNDDIKVIYLQFHALGLIEISSDSDGDNRFILTEKGKKIFYENAAIKSKIIKSKQ